MLGVRQKPSIWVLTKTFHPSLC